MCPADVPRDGVSSKCQRARERTHRERLKRTHPRRRRPSGDSVRVDGAGTLPGLLQSERLECSFALSEAAAVATWQRDRRGSAAYKVVPRSAGKLPRGNAVEGPAHATQFSRSSTALAETSLARVGDRQHTRAGVGAANGHGAAQPARGRRHA